MLPLAKSGIRGQTAKVTEKLLMLAAKIVAGCGPGKPADAVLRAELREQKGLTRDEGREASGAVFAFHRWQGWLDRSARLPEQVRQALQFDRMYREKPESFPDSELRRAVPEWVPDSVAVTPAWLRELQREPALWLRARPGRGAQLAAELHDCQPAAAAGPFADALQYLGAEDLFRTPQFHAGRFELQDLNSQVVGFLCAPRPGETWWDTCAGEGGKTLHLCDLMGNKGRVWASDRAQWRLDQLKRRAARAGVFNYRVELWNGGPKLPTKTKFDGILVDAPCSGVGTWQRNPHARWTTQPADIAELAALQKRLLAHAIPSLKPGGRLIYAVCTLTHAETTEVAAAVEREFPHLERLPLVNPLAADPAGPVAAPLWLWPQTTGGNGMFIAGWRAPAAPVHQAATVSAAKIEVSNPS